MILNMGLIRKFHCGYLVFYIDLIFEIKRRAFVPKKLETEQVFVKVGLLMALIGALS
jgi:hypothetical protein